MNIEILEFYPIERNEEKGLLTGTLRIKLPDWRLHILGIHVSKRKDYWHFTLPGRVNNDAEKPIRFPYVAFEDREKQRQLIDAVRSQAPCFIEKRLADTENPLIFPNRKRNPARPMDDKKSCDNTTCANKTVSIENQNEKPKQSISANGWRDLPPRKSAIPERASKYAKR